MYQKLVTYICTLEALDERAGNIEPCTSRNLYYLDVDSVQGQKKIAIILPKNRDTAIFNRLYIRLYIIFVANNGKNHDSAHAVISFCP